MCTKKIFASVLFMTIFASALYAAEVIEDDSTPYMPYSERVEPATPEPAPAPKTQTKPATKKKATTPRKTTTKKKATTTKKVTAPKQPSSLERGIALMQAERYEAAKPYLLKAIQENRNNPNAWYWYGVYHEKTGKFPQAQYFYSRAVTIDPTFDPLSRVVYYPNDSEKTPLWDPKRPARVYPVETGKNGIAISNGNFPSAPNDPEIPKVPVYTPPEPGANPLDGDAWSPALYVPPSPEITTTDDNMSAVYNPPQAAVEQVPQNENYSYKIPGYSNTYVDVENPSVRADLPLYNPPEPGKAKTVAQTPKQTAPAKKILKEEKSAAEKKSVKTAAAPRKIVKKAPAKTPTKNTKTAAPKKQTNTTNTKSNTAKTPEKKIDNKEVVKTPAPAPTPKRQTATATASKPKTQPAAPKQENKQTPTTNTNKASTTKPASQPKVAEKTPQPKQETQPQTPPQQTPKQQQEATQENSEVANASRPRIRVRPRSQRTQTAQEQTQTSQQEQAKSNVAQSTPARNVENASENRQPIEYLPPVGQFAPDPGTIVEPEIPPVGQSGY